jgi:tetratricopeptide (TPR) repeat protein
MTTDSQASDFFTAGGTLPPDAPSYVKRSTDDELFDHIMEGEFCYVLTPRQMGKSSLMIRTAQRLQIEGVRSAIVDLTVTGTVESEDQWYKGILTQIKRRLRINLDPIGWWETKRDIPNIQKFVEFFEEVLIEVKERIVIFMDEIDTTLKLDFRDDFFAGIRAIYNGRADNPDLKRITFVLLGVASPSDLIKDRNRTPFNIGQEIPLKPFSRNDARMLEIGLEEAYPDFGQKILDRIFYWTNGHPYLTQKLCQSIVEAHLKEYSNNDVDDLVRTLFTSDEASRETNLQFVRDNVLSYPERRVILSLYKKLLRGSIMLDDKNSLSQNHLKLSGLARVDDGRLAVSNRIYGSVFDQKWVSRYVEVDWRYPIIAALSLLVIGFASVFYNDGVRLPALAATKANDISIYRDDRGITYLAELFRMKPILFANEYEYKAKDVFFNQYGTWDDQKTLIEITEYERARPTPEDYKTVIVGLYTSLADVDKSGDTTRLLEVIYSSLEEMRMQDEAIYQEIVDWLDARNSVSRDDFETALEQYTSAIELNSQNPATLFERARVYASLQDYQNALKDYEQVVAIVPSYVEPTEGVAAATQTATFTLSPPPLITTNPTETEKSVVQTATQLLFTKTVQVDGTLALETTVVDLPTSTNTPRPPTAPPILSTNTPISPATNTPIPSITPTATSVLPPIQPRFLTRGQRIAAVRNDIYQNENIASTLISVNPGDYPHLEESNILQTLMPTSIVNPSDVIELTGPASTPGGPWVIQVPKFSDFDCGPDGAVLDALVTIEISGGVPPYFAQFNPDNIVYGINRVTMSFRLAGGTSADVTIYDSQEGERNESTIGIFIPTRHSECEVESPTSVLPVALGEDWTTGCISTLWKAYPSTILSVDRGDGCWREPLNVFSAENGDLDFLSEPGRGTTETFGLFAPLPEKGTVTFTVRLRELTNADLWMGVFAEPDISSKGLLLIIPSGDTQNRMIVHKDPHTYENFTSTITLEQGPGFWFSFTFDPLSATGKVNPSVFATSPFSIPTGQKWLFLGYKGLTGYYKIEGSFLKFELSP